MEKEDNQETSLETMFQELSAIIEKMQERDVTLEESFSLYERGMRKLKLCNEKIDTVEKKMLLLNQQGELEAFDE